MTSAGVWLKMAQRSHKPEREALLDVPNQVQVFVVIFVFEADKKI